jgi:threonine dehydratase
MSEALASGARAARARIAKYVRETPLERSPQLSALTGADVYLKLENYQVTGSFKARGALAKLTTLTPEERRLGVVTASSGNHGAAVAYGSNRLGIKCVVYVPDNASKAKVANIKRWGAEVRFHGDDSGLSELEARKVSEQTGVPYVSPYNDLAVVHGQGTLALEIAEQMPERPDAVIASVGGGGLIAGIAGVLKALRPGVEVLGASPKASCVMVESVKKGGIIDQVAAPTLSDGTAGAVEHGSITFPICRDLVDAYALVSEDEIKSAMATIIAQHQMLIEGSAAVPLAAMAQWQDRLRGKRVVLVLCGANVAVDTLKAVLT